MYIVEFSRRRVSTFLEIPIDSRQVTKLYDRCLENIAGLLLDFASLSSANLSRFLVNFIFATSQWRIE